MIRFGEIGRNDNFEAKMKFFGPFWGQKGEIEIFREDICLAILFKTKK